MLVRVRATTVNRTDCGFRQGKPLIVRFFAGLTRPKRTGARHRARRVSSMPSDPTVTEFAVGDEVFGVNADRFGAHAELVCVRQDARLRPSPRP